MALTANESLDDVPLTDGDSRFTGGQVSATNESAVPASSFVRGVNMDFDPFGRLQTRRSARSLAGNNEIRPWETITTNWNALTTTWGANLAAIAIDAINFFDTAVSKYVVIAQNGGLLQGTESASYSAIAGAAYSGSSVYFAQLVNRLYYCDATNPLKYVDSALTNTAISGGRVTSIKITNQGAGYTSVPAITLSGAATATAVLGYGGRVISANITSASSGYTSVTPPSISFAAAPAGGTTATGIVNISQTPSKPQFLTSHTSRLFCASADTAIPPDTLYASDILDGESWDLAGSSLRVGGDGDPITGLYPWFGFNLLVFKQRSLWSVNCDPTVAIANWQITLINNRIGCVSHRSIQAVGSDVYFLAQDGVRSLSQIQAGTQTDVGQPLSAPVQDEIDNINKAALSKVSSMYYRNRYLLSVPQGTATTPNVTLVYHELAKSWCGTWTNWQPRDWVITGFSNRLRLYFADNSGKVWTWDDFTPVTSETIAQYQDDTSVYESYAVLRAYDFGEPLVTKLGHQVQIFTENRLTDSTVNMYLYYDRDISGTFTALDSAIMVTAGDKLRRRAINMLSKGRFNVIQFKFGATQWKAVLAGIQATAFADNIKPEVNE